MEQMKQGCYASLRVTLDGVTLSNVAKIEFIFKQRRHDLGAGLKCAVWNAAGTGDAYTSNGGIIIPWTREETYRFAAECPFYMDTRITMTGATENPMTPIIALMMDGTLFEEVQA